MAILSAGPCASGSVPPGSYCRPLRHAHRFSPRRGGLADGPLPARNPMSRAPQRIPQAPGRRRSLLWNTPHWRLVWQFLPLDQVPAHLVGRQQTLGLRDDWERIWPELWLKIDRDELEILKRTRSGDVLATELTLGGTTLPVVIKRPRKRYWYRYLYDAFRRSRSWRGWVKGWNLIAQVTSPPRGPCSQWKSAGMAT